MKVLMPSAPPCWNWSRPGISSAPVSAMNADACVAVITSSMNVRRRSLPSLHGKIQHWIIPLWCSLHWKTLEKEIEIKREIEKGRPARAYGRYQNVFLTDEELADLQASFPTVWGQYIEKLSEYMASTGKRYQSHAATIRRWAGEDARKAAPPSRNRDYSVKEDETV